MGDMLFLAHRVPYPPNRGDKIRSYHLLRHIAAHARVHLIAFADDPADRGHDAALSRLAASHRVVDRTRGTARAAAAALAGGEPVSLTAFASRDLADAVEKTLATHEIDTIFVFSGQMAQYVPKDFPGRVVMDFVDMDSAKFAAYAQDARGPRRWMMAREARLLGAFERRVAARADASLFVSAAEAALFRAHGGGDALAIGNGIDTAFFDPAADFARVEHPQPLIVFTGQMDYRPNVDAVDRFARRILPLVRDTVPDARFAIVGRKPDPRVKALGGLPGISVTGEVADVRGWLAAASVVVAPLQLARGVQNKVLEAMAMARPVVASAAAAEGIDHDGAIRVATDAPSLAAEVVRLIDDRAAAAALGAAARARVIDHYGWDARLAALDPVMGFAASARRSAA
ncbi:TIGR03087 family PEP-CTERM/XrtA system glycosyltransferase [Hephaestia mangrovi]|uniref:TIGR03087 family PEP-CTERM/XrtA system glycosyltransferase n=1 Tax=Hephaestia mangrovi TaxID=2873268 RepID=UPI001CA69D30|nr:TIGR03087 family PEP-CTERM/XrtA system glycosyltransferase [Hephaestia mangrovi]MBY8827085.1 TIGR03087 family PEP-CTERM/XrtA system glycosyltransferase [Hephaestia mangrovi]